MISYKQWKLLHENTFNLGIKSPASILASEAPMLLGMKKKMHGGGFGGPKPPLGDTPTDMGDGDGDADDMGGADETDIDHDDMDDMDHDDGDDDADEMGGDEEGDEGDEGEEGGEEDMGGDDMMGDMPKPPMDGKGGPPMKKKMPPMPQSPMMMKKEGCSDKLKGGGDDDVEFDSEVKDDAGEGEEEETVDSDEKKSFGFQKKMKKKMKKEQNEVQKSLSDWCGTFKFAPNEDGHWAPVQEDHLITPDVKEEEEPKPGQVGYAPSGKLGSIGSFQEWAKKHKK